MIRGTTTSGFVGWTVLFDRLKRFWIEGIGKGAAVAAIFGAVSFQPWSTALQIAGRTSLIGGVYISIIILSIAIRERINHDVPSDEAPGEKQLVYFFRIAGGFAWVGLALLVPITRALP